MPQDIRDLLKDSGDGHTLPEGHQSRFQDKLAKALPEEEPQKNSNKKSSNGFAFFLKIAAVLIVAGGIVWFAFAKTDSNIEPQIVDTETIEETEEERPVQLSDLSPQFKKVEDYYLASINVEIARLEITDENKELIDSFLKQLEDLDKEYERLNKEITESGISEEMINAMVENLKLRLELLSKLKKKLNELKASENDAQTI